MNIRDLRYFVALSRLKNFGKAAQACFVSQPTLSMQIKKLEDELNTPLFEREKHFVRTTPAGDALLGYATQILQLIDDMKECAQTFLDPYAGTLKLAIFPTLAPYLLPHITTHIKSSFPNLSLKIFELTTNKCIESLLTGSIDAMIIATHLNEPKLAHLNLFSEKFKLASPTNHPISKFKNVTANRLPEDELLLLEEGHCLRDQGLEYCQRIGKNHNTTFTATSLNTILAMVALGEGITFIPSLAQDACQNLAITLKSFASNAPQRDVILYWRKSFPKSELLLKLAQLIKESVTGLDGVKIAT